MLGAEIDYPQNAELRIRQWPNYVPGDPEPAAALGANDNRLGHALAPFVMW